MKTRTIALGAILAGTRTAFRDEKGRIRQPIKKEPLKTYSVGVANINGRELNLTWKQ
ncbi:hypothetical protein LMH73_023860 [Vibrio splendidus]|nr:hypothetical protein [Vibrio splendidus]MCC4883077.1 hypothetical protein [Vibrio splendidus]